MEKTGRDFADVLREAQGLGYAEADPTMDVGGFDAGHKITILAALAFGCAPDFGAAEIEGISDVELLDIKLAKDLGYRIKLVAGAAKSDDGVPVTGASVAGAAGTSAGPGRRGAQCAVHRGQADRADLHPGPGAGSGPTAAAVAADIADVMTGAGARCSRPRPAS